MHRLLTIVLLSTMLPVGPCLAQTPWNRKAEAIAVVPSGGGGWDLYAVVEVSANASTPTDLRTEVDFKVNGVSVSTEILDLSSGFDCDDCTITCICETVDGSTICECGPWRSLIGPIPTATLRPEDYIEVLLRPAPGAAPEIDTSDDLASQVFDDRPIFWNRIIAGVNATPSPTVPGRFDVVVDLDVSLNYTGALDLGMEVVLIVDGAEGPSFPVPNDWLALPCSGCGDACAWDVDGLPEGYCDNGDACGCYVFDVGQTPIFSVQIPDLSDLDVLLRPVPGALPELPGFGDDDEGEIETCAADLDGDGWVGVSDLLILLGAWGTEDGDVNGDEQTDVADMLALLAAWGACFPV